MPEAWTPEQVAAMRAERLRPAGSRSAPVDPGAAAKGVWPGRDPDLDRPKRLCARCGASFQPTHRRRLLCLSCFTGGHSEG